MYNKSYPGLFCSITLISLWLLTGVAPLSWRQHFDIVECGHARRFQKSLKSMLFFDLSSSCTRKLLVLFSTNKFISSAWHERPFYQFFLSSSLFSATSLSLCNLIFEIYLKTCSTGN